MREVPSIASLIVTLNRAKLIQDLFGASFELEVDWIPILVWISVPRSDQRWAGFIHSGPFH